MSGQNKRKSRSSQGEAVQNITSSKNKNASKNIRPSSKNTKTSASSSQTEVEELKWKILELECKNNELTNQNKILQYQVDNYKSLPLLNDDNESQDEVVSDDDTRTAKRARKKLSDEEEKEKSIIKTLLKTFPGLEPREEEIFTSKTNNDICQQLIPKLQKELKTHKYNLSPEQVRDWLKSIHKSKRGIYLKSNPTPLKEEVDNEQEAESDGATQSAKRQTKSRVKKLGNLTEDDDGSKNKEGLKIEEEVKSLMKRLLENSYTQDEYKFKVEDTFKSQANIDICKMLIPRLLEDVKPMYNPSYEQVENWLGSIHKTKRNTYLKSNKMDID